MPVNRGDQQGAQTHTHKQNETNQQNYIVENYNKCFLLCTIAHVDVEYVEQ